MTNIGLIFDLDGVIIDTAEYHYLAWKQFADEEAFPFNRDDNEALRGVSRRESLRRLLNGREVEEALAQEWMTRKNNYYLEYLTKITPDDILPGVHDFLQSAHDLGYRIGLASASRNAKAVIERLEVAHLFDVLGDGHAVMNTKPAVDLFVWVAGGLGVPAERCIVFEDAEAGVQAALDAGMLCVGIGPEDRVGKAHRVCKGLHDITLEQVQLLAALRVAH